MYLDVTAEATKRLEAQEREWRLTQGQLEHQVDQAQKKKQKQQEKQGKGDWQGRQAEQGEQGEQGQQACELLPPPPLPESFLGIRVAGTSWGSTTDVLAADVRPIASDVQPIAYPDRADSGAADVGQASEQSRDSGGSRGAAGGRQPEGPEESVSAGDGAAPNYNWRRGAELADAAAAAPPDASQQGSELAATSAAASTTLSQHESWQDAGLDVASSTQAGAPDTLQQGPDTLRLTCPFSPHDTPLEPPHRPHVLDPPDQAAAACTVQQGTGPDLAATAAAASHAATLPNLEVAAGARQQGPDPELAAAAAASHVWWHRLPHAWAPHERLLAAGQRWFRSYGRRSCKSLALPAARALHTSRSWPSWGQVWRCVCGEVW